jgi:hypothetical protein
MHISMIHLRGEFLDELEGGGAITCFPHYMQIRFSGQEEGKILTYDSVAVRQDDFDAHAFFRKLRPVGRVEGAETFQP